MPSARIEMTTITTQSGDSPRSGVKMLSIGSRKAASGPRPSAVTAPIPRSRLPSDAAQNEDGGGDKHERLQHPYQPGCYETYEVQGQRYTAQKEHETGDRNARPYAVDGIFSPHSESDRRGRRCSYQSENSRHRAVQKRAHPWAFRALQGPRDIRKM